jgi:hypothetical protein
MTTALNSDSLAGMALTEFLEPSAVLERTAVPSVLKSARSTAQSSSTPEGEEAAMAVPAVTAAMAAKAAGEATETIANSAEMVAMAATAATAATAAMVATAGMAAVSSSRFASIIQPTPTHWMRAEVPVATLVLVDSAAGPVHPATKVSPAACSPPAAIARILVPLQLGVSQVSQVPAVAAVAEAWRVPFAWSLRFSLCVWRVLVEGRLNGRCKLPSITENV